MIFNNRSILLIKQHVPTLNKAVWMPPGGGVAFGEKLEDALIREVKEETNLKVNYHVLQYLHEFYQNKHHAIEFYFYCKTISAKPELGTDPEIKSSNQNLIDIKYIPINDLNKFEIYPVFIREEMPVLAGREGALKYFRTWV